MVVASQNMSFINDDFADKTLPVVGSDLMFKIAVFEQYNRSSIKWQKFR